MDNLQAKSNKIRTGVAYLVHVYTALGLICSLLALQGVFEKNYPATFFWLMLALLIDASDGVLARAFSVKEAAPAIDGRKIDDIVDYLNYTFVPLILIGSAGWLPRPPWLWVGIGLIASVFAFGNSCAKEEDRGFFLGFPSYWNVVAFYLGLHFWSLGQHFVLALLLALSLLSVLPVRFVYPSHAPRWRPLFVAGLLVWLGHVCVLWVQYARGTGISLPLLWGSLVYPLLYVGLSIYLDLASRNPAGSGR